MEKLPKAVCVVGLAAVSAYLYSGGHAGAAGGWAALSVLVLFLAD